MRNSINTLCIVLFGAVLVSCAQEMLPVNEIPEVATVDNPTTHTILIKAGQIDYTRTHIGGAVGNNMRASLWSEGDKLAVYQGYAYGKEGFAQELKESGAGVSENDGQTMVFPVTFDSVNPDDVNSDFMYLAVYPSSAVSFMGWGLQAVLPRNQFPSATSYDPAADILVSRPVSYAQQPTELNLQFKRITALAQMTLVGAPAGLPQGAVVKNVVFYTNAPLASRVYISDGGEFWDTSEYEDISSSIVLSYEGTNLSPTSLNAQFMCMPALLEYGFEVLVTATHEGRAYSYYKDVYFGDEQSLEFTAGSVTAFSVNMSEAEMVDLPQFSVNFDEDTMYNHPELSEQNLVLSSGNANPKKGGGKDDEGEYIGFYVNHNWSVSFSEPWVSATPSHGTGEHSGFYVSAELNVTGTSRSATMTITSDFDGSSFQYTVVQPSLAVPRSVYISSAPSSVSPFVPFEVVCGIDSDNQDDIWYTYFDYDYNEDVVLQRTDDNRLIALNPGKIYVRAYYDDDYLNVHLVSEPVEITVTEPAAPSNWYFLIRRDNKPYLIRRVGSTDTTVELSDNELAQAYEMAFSADGSTVYVVGAVPDPNLGPEEDVVMIPCLWTYNGGSTASRTDYGAYRNLVATDLAVDNSDVYILVSDPNPAGSKDFLVLTNGEEDGRYTLASYEDEYNLTDITAENGEYYICGASTYNYAPYYWRDLHRSSTHYAWPLKNHDLGSSFYNPQYLPESIAVMDDQPYVVGSVRFNYNDFWLYRRALYWQGEKKVPGYIGPESIGESTVGTYYYFHSIVKNNGHFVIVGEAYQDHNSYKDNWAPLLFYDDLDTELPVEYSSAMAGLSDVCLYNGVPALSGVLVDGTNTPRPAFWAAPWSTPFEWGNSTDTIIDFLVK